MDNRPKRPAFTMKQLLIVIAVTATLAGSAVPQIQKWREAELRTQSVQNLKTIGLAFHSFHDLHNRLPYNGTAKPYVVDGVSYGGSALGGDERTGSWAFQILPFVDQKAVFAGRDASVGIPNFMCPGRGRPIMCQGVGGPGAWTDFFLNSFINDPNGAWDVPDIKRQMVGITDGTSNTILLGHGQIRPQNYGTSDLAAGFTEIIFNGGSPALCRPNTIVNLSRDSVGSVTGNWGGPFSAGALMGMVDGTVRMFPYSLTGGTIKDGIGVNLKDVWHDDGGGIRMKGGFGSYLTPTGSEPMLFLCG